MGLVFLFVATFYIAFEMPSELQTGTVQNYKTGERIK
jgi:hypothetical protein